MVHTTSVCECKFKEMREVKDSYMELGNQKGGQREEERIKKRYMVLYQWPEGSISRWSAQEGVMTRFIANTFTNHT